VLTGLSPWGALIVPDQRERLPDPPLGQRGRREIEPVEVEEWLIALHDEEELEWTTLSKFRQVMSHVYTNGQEYGLIPRGRGVNPMKFVTCESSSDYEAMTFSPERTLAVLSYAGEPEKTLTLLIAVTALRISEALGLRWSDVDHAKHCSRAASIRLGAIERTETRASKAPVPMCLMLAEFMKAWQAETPYAGADDYVFQSVKLKGAKPRVGSMISKTYLRQAAVQAGVLKVGEKVRFGFHNLRHSLSTYLGEQGEDPKTAQGILRLAKASTALDIYTHVVPRKALAAQNRFVTSLFAEEGKMVELENAKLSSENAAIRAITG
jgi:integrase